MTFNQIMALLSLLISFGVDQQTVNRVEVILTAPKTAITQSVTIVPMDTPEVTPPVEEKKSKYAQENVPVGGTYTTSPNQQ